MARNQEKAQSMLYRFREASMIEAGLIPRKERPKATHSVHRIDHCRHYRREIVREIGERLVKIQDPGLNEFQIRDLNDQINKMIKEKDTWEQRIRDLGGNFKPYQPDANESAVLPGDKNYRYFGRAKELPGVKELFESTKVPEVKKSRFEMIRSVDADYYGFRDEDDGVLVPIESAIEKQRLEAILVGLETRSASSVKSVGNERKYNKEELQFMRQQLEQHDPADSALKDISPRIPVPSQKDVEKYLINLKKELLLRRYAS